MDKDTQPSALHIRYISTTEIVVILLLVTLITNPAPFLSAGLLGPATKFLAYAAVLSIMVRIALAVGRPIRHSARLFIQTYKRSILWPMVIYFMGLIVGSLVGPDPIASLWQTASDLIVFSFAFIAFGCFSANLEQAVIRLLRVVAILSALMLLIALTLLIGNMAGLWCGEAPNTALCSPSESGMRGIFDNPLVLGYILMTGSLASASLYVVANSQRQGTWATLALLLSLGVMLTLARGALLGTIAGLLAITAIRSRRLAYLLTILAAISFISLSFVTLLREFPQLREMISITEIKPRSFDIYADLTDEEWEDHIEAAGSRLILSPGASATSGDLVMSFGEYRLVLLGRASQGPTAGDSRSYDHLLGYTIRQGNRQIASGRFTLTNMQTFGLGSSFRIEEEAPVQITLSYATSGKPQNGGYAEITSVSLIPPGWREVLLRINNSLPKYGVLARVVIWKEAIANIKSYGIFGVGPGNAESMSGMSTHNLWLEQLGEGGILAITGTFGWLILPLLQIRKSLLSDGLSWAIVGMMGALMIHSLFWTQFLNGLRFLTLVYVCLWTALATQGAQRVDR